MSHPFLADALFQSTTRSALLKRLFVDRKSGSMSELARHAGVTPRAVGREVAHLVSLGLVEVQNVGNADVVRANLKHPAARALRLLLVMPAHEDTVDSAQSVRDALAVWGAPLGKAKRAHRTRLEETLLDGLELARHDGTILRVLPATLAKHLDHVDWAELKRSARRRKLKAELGWLTDLTAQLTNHAELKEHSTDLRDARRHTRRFFPEVKSAFEQDLAKMRTSETARSWGFWMNVSDDAFRSTMERHA